MTPERWQQIRDVLEKALELPPGERSAYLNRACSSDASLRQEVETLLASSDDVRSSFLHSSTLRVTLTSGMKLGEYEVKSLVGAGGMGEVYRARDLRLGRDVAIKVLPAFLSSDSDRLQRFEQEARAAAALSHPNILAVFQMGTFAGAPYLVSELLEGETLREQIKRGLLSVRKSIDYGVQMVRGLAAAHEKGIVHRDLKPENVFVTKDGRVKILDFGLAKLTQSQSSSEHGALRQTEGTKAGVVMGTVGYMSPEQVRGQTADHRADIFAFGAILYEMLAGKRAFQKPTSPETMTAILNEAPPGISQVAANIPLALQRVVHRCLEKNPEQRFQSASDLAFALEALSDSEGSSPSTKTGATGGARRWKVIVPAVLVTLVLSCLFALWWLTPLPEPKTLEIFPVTATARLDYLVRPATDGARVFYVQRAGDHYDLMQAPVNGGDAQKMLAPFRNTLIWDVSPDGSHFLITGFEHRGEPSQLWSWPVTGGAPAKLGDMVSGSATYSPDGKLVAFHIGNDLWIGSADGSSKRRLGTFQEAVDDPAWSPEGDRLRFTLKNEQRSTSSIWEMRLDGTGLRPVLPHWANASQTCCGTWTPDGRYFIFAETGDRARLWALRENRDWLRRSPVGPFLLVSEAEGLRSPVVSRDGRHIYFYSNAFQTELHTLDVSTGQFTAMLPGLHGLMPEFSPDAKWVVFVRTISGGFWRSRPDGSDLRELSVPGMTIGFPRWSPDGKTFVFSAQGLGVRANTYVVDAEGGHPEPLVPGHDNLRDPDWSPDGSRLVVREDFPAPSAETTKSRLAFVGWNDRQVREIPGSDDMLLPRWSPDDKWIAAVSGDRKEMRLLDVAGNRWRTLARGKGISLPIWTADGSYLYYQDLMLPGEPLYREKLSSGAIELVADFQKEMDTGVSRCVFSALTPNGQPVVNFDQMADMHGATLSLP